MRILINALSVTNLSGRHVLMGHIANLAGWTVGEHTFVFLYHRANADLLRDLGPNVSWVKCPDFNRNWLARSLWERSFLSGLIRNLGIDLVFHPTGMVIRNIDVPQISFAQNPWCMVKGIHRGQTEKLKAFLQRLAYREAMSNAKVMIFNSQYMRQAYRSNAGFLENASEVVYQGVDEETFQAAERLRPQIPKKKNQILCVSVMAPHKGVETLIRAFALVRNKHKLDSHLVLIGSWPDLAYRKKIIALAERFCLEKEVSLKGHVVREDLHRYYAESGVFCLMSRCESFGIPSVEAQAFGTPVISSDCCAIPEVCGDGGMYLNPWDVQGVAEQIVRMISEETVWERYSQQAIQNVSRFHWSRCTKPLLKVVKDHFSSGA